MKRFALAAILIAAPTGFAHAESAPINYMLQCQGCHLADGSGKPGSVPSLVDSIGRFVRVPGGREYLVRVPGSSQSSLSDRDLARVLNYMIRSFGPADVAADFRPFDAVEVTQVRRPPLSETESVRRALLSAMEAR
ncbi:MAG: hypothetical protein JRG85_04860 [Deltaproteobacteria bacterium]|nr:hypothetical protein [Deltaproteobacteria bacterium]